MRSLAPRTQPPASRTAVVDLAQARDARRLRDLSERCRTVDEAGRRALSRLFHCGNIFTRQGARLGRDLLLSHQHLLRAAVLIGRAGECDASAPDESDALYREAAPLVDRATQIISRCEAVCARGQ